MKFTSILAFAVLAVTSSVSQAAPLTIWATNGWTQFANDDGQIGPGGGGQPFDAEYLYYKLNGDVLSLGLQAGFDLIDGRTDYNGHAYYAGDLALSFNGVTLGNSTTYEYAVDFGLLTKNNSGTRVDAGSGTGVDPAGLYSVSLWNNGISYTSSQPFAMDAGSLVSGLLSNTSGRPGSGASYYRMVSFNLASLGMSGSNFNMDAHWTMSCGNDAIDGRLSVKRVPEPTSVLLLLGALLMVSLVVSRRKHSF